MRSAASDNSPQRRSQRKSARDGRPADRKPKRSARTAAHPQRGVPLSFEIQSDLTQGRRVQKRIMDGVEKSGFDSHSTFAIKLALEEALVNAIKHGNKLDPKKKVHIQATVTPRRAEIVIEDEGPGFCRADVPDPTADENLCKCCGRGILLIEAFMDRVQWTRGGRRVKMTKKNVAR